MNDEDRPRLDITDTSVNSSNSSTPNPASRPYLSVMFNCCKVYQRVYATADGKRYEGRCPRCMRTIRFVVGPGGTTDRSFVVE